MHPADIQSALKKKGHTQKSVAKHLGVTEMAISRVIHRMLITDRLMREIANIIGKDHKKVFPEYYNSPPKRSTSKVN